MNTRKIYIVLTVVILLLATAVSSWGVGQARALPGSPGLSNVAIPYSGSLVDDAGQPVADGSYAISFALYTVQTGGQPVWAEVHEDVKIKGGVFSAFLGEVNPIGRELLVDNEGWLAVSVRGPGEVSFTLLEPRQRLGALPTAGVSADAACAHDHFAEKWTGSSYASESGLEVINTAGYAFGLTGISGDIEPSSSPTAAGVFGYSQSDVGVAAWSTYDVGLWANSTNGRAIVASGTGTIHSVAPTVMYISPHDMVIRSDSSGLTLRPQWGGGMQIDNLAGSTSTKYITLPVDILGTLTGSIMYIKSARICYKALNGAKIVATAVTKNDGTEAGELYYLLDSTLRTSSVYDCYEIAETGVLKAVNNTTWVQFNIQGNASLASSLFIYTVKLTLDETGSGSIVSEESPAITTTEAGQ